MNNLVSRTVNIDTIPFDVFHMVYLLLPTSSQVTIRFASKSLRKLCARRLKNIPKNLYWTVITDSCQEGHLEFVKWLVLKLKYPTPPMLLLRGKNIKLEI